MTGICGLVGREADDLESKAKTMLSLMEDRVLKSRTLVQSLPDREKTAIGICDSSDAQSLGNSAIPLALDGVFFGDDQRHGNPAPAGPSRLIQTAVAFASLKSPLKAIGIHEPWPVSPGKIIRASVRGYETVNNYSLKQRKEEPISELDATYALDELFREAVRRIVPRRSGIAFSGGLDSALVAKVARSEGLAPELISVGLRGQPELEHAEKTAKSFGIQANVRELSSSEILD